MKKIATLVSLTLAMAAFAATDRKSVV